MQTKPLALFAAGLLVGLAAPPTAIAAFSPEVEPNNDLLQVAGPSVGSDGVSGTLAGPGDIDLHLVYLRPQRQVRFTFETADPDRCTGPNDNNIHGRLTMLDGTRLGDSAWDLTWKPSYTWTTTTPGVFGGPSFPALVRVEYEYGGDIGSCAYTLRLTGPGDVPSDAIDPNPPPTPPTVQVGEPNDVPAQAYGLLAGGVAYTGAFETEPDIDWLALRLAPGRQVAIEGTAGSGGARVELVRARDPKNDYVTHLEVDGNQSIVKTFQVPDGSNAYYLKVSGGNNDEARPGSRWRLRLTPADAVLGPPPPTCRIRSTRIRRGQPVRLRCDHMAAGTRLEVRWYRRTRTGRYQRLASRWITTGRSTDLKTSSAKRRRGTYRVSVWLGKSKLRTRVVRMVK